MAAHFDRAPPSNRGRGMQGEWLNILSFVARTRPRPSMPAHDAVGAALLAGWSFAFSCSSARSLRISSVESCQE